MGYNNYNNYKKSSGFEVFKIIFQIIGTFLIFMVIKKIIHLECSAGKKKL